MTSAAGDFSDSEHFCLGRSRDSSWYWDSVARRADGVELSLKLYHGYDLRLGYQQLIAEAPHILSIRVEPLTYRLKPRTRCRFSQVRIECG
jgi:hypothetical protein